MPGESSTLLCAGCRPDARPSSDAAPDGDKPCGGHLAKDHATPGGLPPAPGPDAIAGFRHFFGGMLHAFPDLTVDIQDMITEGDRVVTRKVMRGTHRGDLWGAPPTGKEVQLEVIDIFRVADGKLAEHWTQLDVLAVARQLGIRPPGS